MFYSSKVDETENELRVSIYYCFDDYLIILNKGIEISLKRLFLDEI